jgi:16S rRNA G527 N7-methylase RsmG
VVFLREASKQLNVTIIARPFEDVPAPPVSFVTCRALDQFTRKLPAIINWALQDSKLLLFGGETLGEQLNRIGVSFEQFLIPQSDRRYLFLTTD